MSENQDNVLHKWYDADAFPPPYGLAVLCERVIEDKFGPVVVACRMKNGMFERLNDAEQFSGVKKWLAFDGSNPDSFGRDYLLAKVMEAVHLE